MAVSQVCKDWRRLALNTPQLWTFINARGSNAVDRADLWLERAKGLPLHIHLNSERTEYPFNTTVKKLGPHLLHCCHLELRVIEPNYMRAVFSSLSRTGTKYRLKELTLENQRESRSQYTFRSSDDFFHAMKDKAFIEGLKTLQYLRLKDLYLPTSSRCPTLFSLSGLSMSCNGLPRSLTGPLLDNIFRLCPSLAFLRLDALRFKDPPPSTAELSPIVMGSLKQVELLSLDSHVFSRITTIVSMPILSKATISNVDDIWEVESHSRRLKVLSDFITAYGTSLQHLLLESHELDTNIGPLFRDMPHLISISLIDVFPLDPILDTIASETLYTQLTSVELGDNQVSSENVELLRRLIEQPGRQTLRRLRIGFCRSITKDQADWLQENVPDSQVQSR